MKVTVVSPERIVFSGEVDSVAVPGAKGRFEILNNHAPIVSALTAGKVVCSGKETLELDILASWKWPAMKCLCALKLPQRHNEWHETSNCEICFRADRCVPLARSSAVVRGKQNVWKRGPASGISHHGSCCGVFCIYAGRNVVGREVRPLRPNASRHVSPRQCGAVFHDVYHLGGLRFHQSLRTCAFRNQPPGLLFGNIGGCHVFHGPHEPWKRFGREQENRQFLIHNNRRSENQTFI